MNKTYRDIMLTQIAGAVAKTEAAIVHHKGLEGRFKEIVLREMLRPLLPNYIGLGTGKVITYDNQYSREQDVIVYDSRILPPILLDHSTGIFPIESVLATIEVKSVLNATHLRSSHESAAEIRGYPILSGFFDEKSMPIQRPVIYPVPCIMAFSTDLQLDGKTEVERYSDIHGSDNPIIHSICVVGRGVSLHLNSFGGWNYVPSDGNFSEILYFLFTLIHSYDQIARNRGQPRIGEYFINPRVVN